MENLSKHLISPEKCEALAKEYDNSNYLEINKKRDPAKPDSLEYFFKLETLKDYIEQMQKEMEQKGIRNKGIKIRLGKYPSFPKDPDLDPALIGYQTVFLAAVDLDEVAKKGEGATGLPGMNYGQLRPPY